jgi:hypothetical protein
MAVYQTLLDDAFSSAFDMVDRAMDAIGNLPTNGAPGQLWEYPDSETKDLSGRIFGDGVELTGRHKRNLADRLKVIKSELSMTERPSLALTEC